MSKRCVIACRSRCTVVGTLQVAPPSSEREKRTMPVYGASSGIDHDT